MRSPPLPYASFSTDLAHVVPVRAVARRRGVADVRALWAFVGVRTDAESEERLIVAGAGVASGTFVERPAPVLACADRCRCRFECVPFNLRGDERPVTYVARGCADRRRTFRARAGTA